MYEFELHWLFILHNDSKVEIETFVMCVLCVAYCMFEYKDLLVTLYFDIDAVLHTVCVCVCTVIPLEAVMSCFCMVLYRHVHTCPPLHRKQKRSERTTHLLLSLSHTHTIDLTS